ncbi:MAG TPA: hypothetical protein VKC34_13270 [Blastocatellia bacterium]|nr:hypothetical protein [Blastocatellia bacterium]
MAKSAYVTTNDAAKPSFNLILRALFKLEPRPGDAVKSTAFEGKRVGAFAISPADRWMGGVIRGTATRTSMYLLNKEAAPVHIKEVVPGGDTFKVQVQPIEDGKRYELVVVSDPGLKPGQYTQTVKLKTDSSTAPETAVVLELVVYPKVMVSPTNIVVPMLPTSIDLSALALPKIYIRKPREGGLKILKVASSLDFIRPLLVTEKEGEFYTIDLKFDSQKTKPGEFDGKIRIETNDAESPVIEVPIKCSFRAQ